MRNILEYYCIGRWSRCGPLASPVGSDSPRKDASGIVPGGNACTVHVCSSSSATATTYCLQAGCRILFAINQPRRPPKRKLKNMLLLSSFDSSGFSHSGTSSNGFGRVDQPHRMREKLFAAPRPRTHGDAVQDNNAGEAEEQPWLVSQEA